MQKGPHGLPVATGAVERTRTMYPQPSGTSGTSPETEPGGEPNIGSYVLGSRTELMSRRRKTSAGIAQLSHILIIEIVQRL